jgi:hypothetical protein
VSWRKARMYPNLPHFVGEFGVGADAGKRKRDTALHNGLWSSVVAASSGAASTWYWTYPGYVDYSAFLPLHRAVVERGWPFAERQWTPLQVSVATNDEIDSRPRLQGFATSGRRLGETAAAAAAALPDAGRGIPTTCDPVEASTHVWVWLRSATCTFSHQDGGEDDTPRQMPTAPANVTLLGDISLGRYTVTLVDTRTGRSFGDDGSRNTVVQCYDGLCLLHVPPVLCDLVVTLVLLDD